MPYAKYLPDEAKLRFLKIIRKIIINEQILLNKKFIDIINNSSIIKMTREQWDMYREKSIYEVHDGEYFDKKFYITFRFEYQIDLKGYMFDIRYIGFV